MHSQYQVESSIEWKEKKQRSQKKEGKEGKGEGKEERKRKKRMDHGNNPQKYQYLSIMQKKPTEETKKVQAITENET